MLRRIQNMDVEGYERICQQCVSWLEVAVLRYKCRWVPPSESSGCCYILITFLKQEMRCDFFDCILNVSNFR